MSLLPRDPPLAPLTLLPAPPQERPLLRPAGPPLPISPQIILPGRPWSPLALESLTRPLESDQHRDLISNWLSAYTRFWQERWGKERSAYISGNTTIFYRCPTTGVRRACGPDFFVVLDADPSPRTSWVVEDEGGRYPNFIAEFLSDGTAKGDRTRKKSLYQNVFKTEEYIWFHPITLEFAGFRLAATGRYRKIRPNAKGWLWSEQLQVFIGVVDKKLRLLTAEGELLPFPVDQIAEIQAQKLATWQERMRRIELEEQVAAERQAREAAERDRQAAERDRQQEQAAREAAERDRQAADQARQQEQAAREAAEARVRALADRLRQQGIDPETL